MDPYGSFAYESSAAPAPASVDYASGGDIYGPPVPSAQESGLIPVGTVEANTQEILGAGLLQQATTTSPVQTTSIWDSIGAALAKIGAGVATQQINKTLSPTTVSRPTSSIYGTTPLSLGTPVGGASSTILGMSPTTLLIAGGIVVGAIALSPKKRKGR